MGWFKSQMWKVLQWADDSKSTIVYRFDMQGREIMSGSQLTVRESQAAVFVHQGQIADVFGPGQHKLETKNLPILSGLGAIFYGGESRFKAELYFVNMKQFVDCKWGTSNPVTMRDSEFGMIRIGAHGNYSFRVTDPATFLREVFGTNGKYTVADIEGNIRTMIVTQLSDSLGESKLSALDLAQNYNELGQKVLVDIQPKMAALGLTLTDINVQNINFPREVEDAIDQRTSLGILAGQMDTYVRKKVVDALGDAATNPGSTGTLVGVGLGASMGGIMGGVVGGTVPPASSTPTKYCSNCGAPIATDAKFCSNCGAKCDTGKTCPSCGKPVDPSAKFCPECGGKLA